MAIDNRLSDLLLDWELGRKNGREPAIEELCRDVPNLIPVVRESIESLRATEWMVQSESSEASAACYPDALHDTELPASHLTAEEFTASVFQSGLLPREEMERLRQRLAVSGLPREAREVATRLVTEGKLTRYQASVLLKASNDPLLVDNYVILDTIDTGGMGLVFKALHRSMNRVVALKLLPASMRSARDTVKRFQREVKASAALKHPNVVAAYDADESSDIAYLVLEYVEGTNLFRLVKDQGPLPVSRAVNYVRQAAAGLGYLHSRGIIHRDVKPANLILATDGTVKLLDMGLVRFASSEDLSCAEMDQELTQAGIVIGTVAYMSPEQALDTRSADERSDVYSLGCTLYFLLTGHALYREETGMKTLLAHREEAVPTLRQNCEGVPVSLDAVFRTMVTKRPSDRLQSMEEVIAALDACVPALPSVNQAPAPASPASFLPRRLKSGRRFKTFVTTAVALGILSAGVGAYFAGILIRVKTRHGTTDLYVDDPNASVEIKQVPKSASNLKMGSTTSPPSPSRTRIQPSELGSTTGNSVVHRRRSGRKRANGGMGVDPEGVSKTPGPAGSIIQQLVKPSPSQLLATIESNRDPDRAVALWIQSGTVGARMKIGHPPRYFAGIPMQDFKIRAIEIATAGEIEIPPLVVRRMNELSALNELSLSGGAGNDGVLREIQGLAHLESLNLRDSRVSDGGLRWLSGMTQLGYLDLSNTKVTDDGLKTLVRSGLFSHLAHVTLRPAGELRLSGTRTTEAGIDAFRKATPNCRVYAAQVIGDDNLPLPPLPGSGDRAWAEWILTNVRFAALKTDVDSENWLHTVPEIPPIDFQIRAIEFSDNNLGYSFNGMSPNVAILHHLSDLKGLQSLSFIRIGTLDWRILEGVAALQQLKVLEVTFPVPDEGLALIAKLKQLERLQVNGLLITDAGVKELAPLQQLASLTLTGPTPHLQGSGLKALIGLKKLSVLNLAGSGLNDNTLANVAFLQGLQTLNLSDTWLTGAGLTHLSKLSRLNHLDLSACRRLTGANLSALQKLPDLRGLNLQRCRLDDTAVPALKGLKSLKSLDLRATRMTNDGCEKVRQALPGCRVFESSAFYQVSPVSPHTPSPAK